MEAREYCSEQECDQITMRAGLRRKGLGSAKLALAGSGAGFLRVQGCAHLAGALRVSRDTSALPRAFPVVPLDHISQRNQVERMQHLPPPLALALRIPNLSMGAPHPHTIQRDHKYAQWRYPSHIKRNMVSPAWTFNHTINRARTRSSWHSDMS